MAWYPGAIFSCTGRWNGQLYVSVARAYVGDISDVRDNFAKNSAKLGNCLSSKKNFHLFVLIPRSFLLGFFCDSIPGIHRAGTVRFHVAILSAISAFHLVVKIW